jgi:hypothetical protein
MYLYCILWLMVIETTCESCSNATTVFVFLEASGSQRQWRASGVLTPYYWSSYPPLFPQPPTLHSTTKLGILSLAAASGLPTRCQIRASSTQVCHPLSWIWYVVWWLGVVSAHRSGLGLTPLPCGSTRAYAGLLHIIASASHRHSWHQWEPSSSATRHLHSRCWPLLRPSWFSGQERLCRHYRPLRH